MTVLLLVIAFAAAAGVELWALTRNAAAEEAEERRSRRALLAELEAIEQHRGDHIVD